ncbi:MAG: serine/threonine protein kinase [Myxococcales bacterium]|nr:serine/threonine protein kinase [Myxococcales bacterium]
MHAARDQRLARDVALKALPADAAGAAEAARLLREARVTARLDHPGVLAVHDVGALPDGRAFYTMRLVRGRSLAQALSADDAALARDLVRHVLAACEAVGYAHAVGLVHRDLKPANVLIGPHGETQVADWGLAAPTPAAAERWADLPGPRPSAGGSPGFVAPEQARGEPPDPRHDVWSLGAMLARVAPPADAPLAAIVQRAQAADLGARYADAGALAADLARWFEGRRVLALRYGPLDWARWAWRAWRAPLLVAGAGAVS